MLDTYRNSSPKNKDSVIINSPVVIGMYAVYMLTFRNLYIALFIQQVLSSSEMNNKKDMSQVLRSKSFGSPIALCLEKKDI